MRHISLWLFLLSVILSSGGLYAQDGLIEEFPLDSAADIALKRLARAGTPFDKCGRRFVILGDESGSFEAWAYPLKLLRNFTFSFYTETSTRPIAAEDIVQSINVTPEVTALTYSYQSFSVKAAYIVPLEDPGAIILLKVSSTVPLTIVCGFLPVLQPMWPGGIGGQFAYWNNDLRAYVISESSGKNHGLVGSPAASGLSYTPAHMLADAPNEFKIVIPDPDQLKNRYIPIIVAGGKGNRDDTIKVYKALQADPERYHRINNDHYRRLLGSTLQVRTPDPDLNQAYAWAKVAFDNLIVDHPELGKGLVAGLGASGTSGRPGFGWFFGGDAYVNSLSLSGYGAHQDVQDILAFTQKWQREDGKMAHELSQAEGYIDWWSDYPYGYIHGDTTPYYIAAMYEYLLWSGDIEFIRSSWESLQKAYQWCLTTDANKDGLMDNSKAGLGALEYGALTGIETDIYLSAVWIRAAFAMQRLAAITGREDYAAEVSSDYQKAEEAFQRKFWNQEDSFYAYAFNTDGEHVKEISPWNAVGLMWHLGTPERSRKSLEKLVSSQLVTDWGIRSISSESRYFQSLNYNYGAVWPFLTSWVTTALYQHRMPLQAFSLLKAIAGHTFRHGLGSITEVFSGTHHIWPQEAVSHQGFSSAGVTLPVIKGLLGLEGNALAKSVAFAPQFPADWADVSVSNLKIGNAGFSFKYSRSKDKVIVRVSSSSADGFEVRLAPVLGIGTQITSARLDGKPITLQTHSYPQILQPQVSFPLRGDSALLELDFLPTTEILPFAFSSKVGDVNQGLKIISVQRKKELMDVHLQGLSGRSYVLPVYNPGFIANIEGGTLTDQGILIRFPENDIESFLPHRLTIRLRGS